MTINTVLVVGSTGDLGGRVVEALLARGKRVRALVRTGTDPGRLAAKGVEVARGDMIDPASLDRALAGIDAVVTTAAGYVRRRKGDSLRTVDDRGNRNLVDAAKKAGVQRFVFTSILTCDEAPGGAPLLAEEAHRGLPRDERRALRVPPPGRALGRWGRPILRAGVTEGPDDEVRVRDGPADVHPYR